MKYINLTQGRFSIIDDEDYEKVNKFKWYFVLKSKTARTGYAVHDFRANPDIIKKFGAKHITLHRFIINPNKEKEIDHINHNGLDNRKKNLRVCTRTFNNGNLQMRKDNTSGYKGVEKSTCSNRWFARIRFRGKRIYLGCFKTSKEAATVYNKAAIKYFGSFANINNV